MYSASLHTCSRQLVVGEINVKIVGTLDQNGHLIVAQQVVILYMFNKLILTR
uniref:Uncharacterized protein n=1 Tax=Arundo donax TaxID=35708 RepID=A0A0A8YVL8_ARUDO